MQASGSLGHRPSVVASASASAGPSIAAGLSRGAGAITNGRLYVGNLAASIDEYALVQVFQKHGKLTKLDFMYHKTGTLKGKPRGYAFVEMQSNEDAQKAMKKLHDRLLRGRKLVVTPASSAPPENAPLPSGSRGRRAEPVKQTTLSLLKSKQKPSTNLLRAEELTASAAAQIAAMEAKLATMQSRKPADEDWVPGQSFSIAGSAGPSTSGSRQGSAAPEPGEHGHGTDGEEQGGEVLGEEEGRMAAQQLEREMMDEILGAARIPEEGSKAHEAEQASGLPVKGKETEQEGEKAEARSSLPSVHGLPAKPQTSAPGSTLAPSRLPSKSVPGQGPTTLPKKPSFL